MCVGDKRKEEGKCKASESGRLGIDKTGIAESPKVFLASVVASRGKVTLQSGMCFLQRKKVLNLLILLLRDRHSVSFLLSEALECIYS